MAAARRGEKIAEAMRVAPVVLGFLAIAFLPAAADSVAPHEFITIGTFAGLAIEIGLVGGAAIFVARPTRVIALAWFLVLEAILALTFAANISDTIGVLLPYRLIALAFVGSIVAGITALSPTGWRPPPIRWEE